MNGELETIIAVAAICLAGGFIGGIVGVGGGILFVPAMVIFLDYSQVEAESTSLLMIVIVCFAGTLRQRRYGNVSLRHAGWIALFSPVGVAIGVVTANAVSERVLELGFAALALFLAAQILLKTRRQTPLATAAPEPVAPAARDRNGRG